MKNLISRSLNSSFLKGGFLLTTSNFLVGFLNYIFNVLAGRALGPIGYGEIATLFSYLTLISIPMGVIGSLIIQKIGNANNPEEQTAAIHEWLFIKIRKYWYFIFLLILITPFLAVITNLNPSTSYVLSFLIFLTIIGSFYSNAITALHMFAPQSLLSITGALIKLSGAMIAFGGFGGLNSVLLMIIVSSIIQIFFTFIIIKNKLSKKISNSINKIEKKITDVFKDTQLWYTLGVTTVFTLLGSIDIIFVKRLFSSEDAGIFGAWSVFSKIIFYVLGPIISLSFIFFSSKKYQLWHKQAFLGLFFFIIISGSLAHFVYIFYAKELIEMLFGVKFLKLMPYMEWASLFGIGYSVMIFMMQYFLAIKSKICLIPVFLIPIYSFCLAFFSKNIFHIMIFDTLYVYAISIFFLIVFLNQHLTRLLHFIKK